VTLNGFSGRGFLRDEVIRLLQELETRPRAQDVAMDVRIVGGAALLLHGLIDRATADIDARYSSAAVVDEIVQQMAEEYGLPERWLNSNAVAFLPDNVS
jgi:hypothetical protein